MTAMESPVISDSLEHVLTALADVGLIELFGREVLLFRIDGYLKISAFVSERSVQTTALIPVARNIASEALFPTVELTTCGGTLWACCLIEAEEQNLSSVYRNIFRVCDFADRHSAQFELSERHRLCSFSGEFSPG